MDDEKKEQEVKKENKNQQFVDFYLEYVRNTRISWQDQDLIKNQQHAYLGLGAEMGNLTNLYKDVIGFNKKIDVTEVFSTIGYISYYLARVLDELFYKHEEPFSRIDSTTVFDNIALEMGNILGNTPKEQVEDIEIIDLILSIPCYYRDIYVGATTKDGRSFITGVLSLTSNLADICYKLDKNYGKVLEECIKSLKPIEDGK